MAFLPVKLVLVALKEVVRVRKIAAGVHHAHHAYHHGFLIMVIVGYVKGQGLEASKCSESRSFLCVLFKSKERRSFPVFRPGVVILHRDEYERERK